MPGWSKSTLPISRPLATPPLPAERLAAGMKLTVNARKPRCLRCPEEPMEFLGRRTQVGARMRYAAHDHNGWSPAMLGFSTAT